MVVWLVSLSEELMLNLCLFSIDKSALIGLNLIKRDGSEEVEDGTFEIEYVSSSSFISF